MTNIITSKKGLESSRLSITPASGEAIYTTDDKKVYIGDGVTAGGNPVGGGASASIEAVATGALSNGSKVILNSDGTVSIVAQTIVNIPEDIPAGAGAEYVFNSAIVLRPSISFDPNNVGKFVVAYADSGNASYGTAVVGTVSGTTISFGAKYVFNSGSTQYNSISFDPNTAGTFVVAYQDVGNAKYGTAVVGTVSGTTLSFGAEYVFNTAISEYISCSFDPNTAGTFVVAYQDVGNAKYGTAVVGTVSGTTLSFGAEYVFNTAITYYNSCSFDPNTTGNFVVAYYDQGNHGYGTAVVGTVSGTTITFGAEYVYNSAITNYISVSFDSTANKFVVAYSDTGTSNSGTAIIGTVSGTTISFGAEYVFNSGNTNDISCSFDPNTAGKFVVAYKDNGNASYGTAIVGTVSGSTISYGAESVFNSADTDHTCISFDPTTGKFVVAYRDGGNGYYGTAILGQVASTTTTTNLTSDNFVGISDAAYLTTETATIQVVGATNYAQSGLTPADAYYVQGDGTLSVTPDTPSVYAGIALSSSSLIIKG